MLDAYRVSRVVSLLMACGVLPFAWGTLAAVPHFPGTLDQITLALLAVAWIVSPFAAVVGTWSGQTWGIWALYVSLCTGVLYGSTILPFWHLLPAPEVRGFILLTLNLVLLGLVAVAHWRLRLRKRAA